MSEGGRAGTSIANHGTGGRAVPPAERIDTGPTSCEFRFGPTEARARSDRESLEPTHAEYAVGDFRRAFTLARAIGQGGFLDQVERGYRTSRRRGHKKPPCPRDGQRTGLRQAVHCARRTHDGGDFSHRRYAAGAIAPVLPRAVGRLPSPFPETLPCAKVLLVWWARPPLWPPGPDRQRSAATGIAGFLALNQHEVHWSPFSEQPFVCDARRWPRMSGITSGKSHVARSRPRHALPSRRADRGRRRSARYGLLGHSWRGLPAPPRCPA